MPNLKSYAVTWLWATTIVALPHFDFGTNKTVPDIPQLLAGDSISKRGVGNNVQLRVLSLGASIVYGVLSSDGNGFRYGLRNQLAYDGNSVNMIGSAASGTMVDNDVEGWPGYVIDQVAAKAELSIPSQPNIVLLHVGTNDMTGNVDIGNAHVRLSNLIDRLFDAIPGVTIIASTLLPNGDAAAQPRIAIYNSNIPPMIKAHQSAGKKITYVDFSSSWWSLSDIQDGTHPTDAGYQKMAAVWYQGIQVADKKGWITAPATVAGVSDVITASAGRVCDKVPGNAICGSRTQVGSGVNDGSYAHNSISVGGFSGFKNPTGVTFNNPFPEGVFWVDVNGDGIDDYVYVAASSNLGLGIALSLGGGNLGPYGFFGFSPECIRAGVTFADMTGDGRDDFCCIGETGDVTCWQNTPGTDARNPNWVSMGVVKTSEGYPRSNVRLADIDGDGRADYVCLDGNGAIWGWRNGATSNVAPGYWYKMLGVISGLPLYDLDGWKFTDLNGDHRDDLVWVNKATGQVTTWINQRGYNVGLGPAWQSMGITHAGFGAASNVAFGKFMGTGRADYSRIATGDGTVYGLVYIDRYQNQDVGGTMVKADGSRYCDMRGIGSDDYIWISSTGDMTIYGNEHVWGSWIQYGEVFNINRARREIAFADFDGDGKCDIMLIDKATGATTVLRNDYANGKFSFTNIGLVTGSATCTEGYGYDMHDTGVRWNDLDGDGRADFLCMESNGRITGYLNKGVGNMLYQGQIKHTEGKERKNLRLADINGDGRDDLLWLDMVTGQMVAWHNNGPIPTDGSAFNWAAKGVVANGNIARGSAIELPNLYGLGRADYLSIDPQTNQAWVCFNVCPGGTLEATTPNLPSGAPTAPEPVAVGSQDPEPVTDPDAPNTSCSNPKSFFQLNGWVGQQDYDNIANLFCASNWVNGIFPNMIEVRADVDAVRYLRVGFTDGTEIIRGVAVGDDGHQRYGTIRWDPFNDHFLTFSLWDGGWNGGVGRIVLETSNLCGTTTCKIDVGKYWDSPPAEQKVDLGPSGRGMLLGFFGASGDDLDGLQPLITKTAPQGAVLNNMVVKPSFEDLNNNPADQQGLSAINSYHVLTNRLTDASVVMSTNLYITTQEQSKVTKTSENGAEYGGEIGGTLGLEYSGEFGVPVIVSGSAKGKFEVTGKWVGKTVWKEVKSVEDTISKTTQVRYTITTTVGPGQSVRCGAAAFQGSVTLGYTGVISLSFEDGNTLTYSVQGIFKYALSSEAVSFCENADETLDIASGATITTITESGTYCADGTRVGDIGFTDEELAAACPV